MNEYERELKELEERIDTQKRREHTFYEDQPPMKPRAGSAKYLGNFDGFSNFYLDKASQKLMRTPLR